MQEKFFSIGDIQKIVKVPYIRLNYLFQSGKLNKDDFGMVGGNRVFTEADIEKIREALGTIKKNQKLMQ